MDILSQDSDYAKPATSALSYGNVSFSKTEDSGYQTFTPGSLECSELPSEFFDQSIITSKSITAITGQIQIEYIQVTPEINIHLNRRYNHSTAYNDSLSETPPLRRGLKRPYCSTDKTEVNGSSIPTPTSFIAGKIKDLDFNENKENARSISPVRSLFSEKLNKHLPQPYEYEQILSYPTTPVKKNCLRSPCKRSAKKLNFTIHSIFCEPSGLQSVGKPRSLSKSVRTALFRPDKKVDIIRKLFQEAHALPPVMKILNYLSNEDIHNFSLVSKDWQYIWTSISDKNKKKQEYRDFLKMAKENQENRDKGVTPETKIMKTARCLRVIHNEMNEYPLKIGHSPPGTPRTNRFKKFTKSASLDPRIQLSCVRCCQPAKVTEESSGEVWVECTNKTCLYQFCKYCKCERHPGKFCFQYDLNGPSPSKRKKSQYAVGTKKSKKNLRRLL